MSDLALFCQGMWQEISVCHGYHSLPHLPHAGVLFNIPLPIKDKKMPSTPTWAVPHAYRPWGSIPMELGQSSIIPSLRQPPPWVCRNRGCFWGDGSKARMLVWKGTEVVSSLLCLSSLFCDTEKTIFACLAAWWVYLQGFNRRCCKCQL